MYSPRLTWLVSHGKCSHSESITANVVLQCPAPAPCFSYTYHGSTDYGFTRCRLYLLRKCSRTPLSGAQVLPCPITRCASAPVPHYQVRKCSGYGVHEVILLIQIGAVPPLVRLLTHADEGVQQACRPPPTAP